MHFFYAYVVAFARSEHQAMRSEVHRRFVVVIVP